MATFGIIYASGSKMIRRIISGSTNLQGHVSPSESLLTVEQALPPNVFEAQTAVKAATGVKPASTSCAVVDGAGVIKRIIKADPTIDSVDSYALIPTYEGVTEVCTYDAKTGLFVAPDVIVIAGDRLGHEGTIAVVDTKLAGGPIAKPVSP